MKSPKQTTMAICLYLLIIGLLVAGLRSMALAATATINLSQTNQTLRGFGGASVWLGQLTDANMNTLFGTGPGTIGLTIDRVRIAPDGNWNDELQNAKKVVARGGIVMATPWTPPASMKTNNNVVGGSLKSTEFANYANYLQSFVNFMSSNGVSLYAISVQNEPDIQVTYESCDWTASQLLTFARNNAGAISTRVIMSESFHFNKAFTDPILNDSVARGNVDIIGGHIYGSGLADYPLARNSGKEVWMTEHLNTDTSTAGIIQTAKEMVDCMAIGNYNAYIWWYLKRFYGPIDDNGNRTKRGCVMAQFARWIRPGYVRVGATYNPSTNVFVCAFKSGSLVRIVAVNTGTSSVNQTFSISGGTVPATFQRYRTSGSEDLATLGTINTSGGSFTASLPGQSITSFVSQ
ncbi:MAG TPA: glycoside hydrolase family 30 beta sandwich domain-containing protein [Blastocatellia bacterium]|nr:glycoside hydrolase family 30 beta sandwich domain-containing protein [Blastocatellia bacterium]